MNRDIKRTVQDRLSDLLLELNYLQHLINSNSNNKAIEMIVTLRREVQQLQKELKHEQCS